MSRRGIEPRSAALALRGSDISSGAPVPIPEPYAPGRATLADLGVTDPGETLCLYNLGDSGCDSKGSGPQDSVAYAMTRDAASDGAAFAWHNGDWGYYGCDWAMWTAQVQESYARLPLAIFGIPGNHDDARGGDPPIPTLTQRPALDVWMAAMCSRTPAATPGDPDNEYKRLTEIQPSHDWTLQANALTIVGAWTNVPSGGSLEQRQIDRLTAEIAAAPKGVPLAVAVHHPPLSIDTHHGGSQKIYDILSAAFTTAGRAPDVVLCGHVHDFQCFEWDIAGAQTLVILCGNSGYNNLHPIAPDYTPGMVVEPGVICRYADASRYGYVKLRSAGGQLSGTYVQVTPGRLPDFSDAVIDEAFAF